MRSYFGKAGDFNLHGRKSLLLSCRCCAIYDLRDRVNDNEVRQEINQAMTYKDYRRELRDESEMAGLSDWEDRIFDQYWIEYNEAA